MNLIEERDVENIYKIIMDYNKKKILSNDSLFKIIEKNKNSKSDYNIVLLYVVKKLSYNDWEIKDCCKFMITKFC